jgi:hypothetical protein
VIAVTLHQKFLQNGVTLGKRNAAVRHDGSVAEKQEDHWIKAWPRQCVMPAEAGIQLPFA